MPPRRSLMARAPLASSANADQAEIADQEIILDALQHGLLGRRADLAAARDFPPAIPSLSLSTTLRPP